MVAENGRHPDGKRPRREADIVVAKVDTFEAVRTLSELAMDSHFRNSIPEYVVFSDK